MVTATPYRLVSFASSFDSSGSGTAPASAPIGVLAATLPPLNLADITAGDGFVLVGRDAGDHSGSSVASAGDINGDGFPDLIIAACNADGADNTAAQAGESYVVFGKAAGFGARIDLDAIAAGDGGFVIHGIDAGDYAGCSIASAGDINGDGFGDLIIGAPDAEAENNALTAAGESYVVFGKAGGFGASIDLATVATGEGGFVIYGAEARDRAGRAVSSAGDINGDGYADLLVGAPNKLQGVSTATDGGETYVVFGGANGFGSAIRLADVETGHGGFVIGGRDSGDMSGFAVAAAGDVNGDGFDDIVIGAPYAEAGNDEHEDSGEAYVVFGKAAGFDARIELDAIAAGSGGFAIQGEDQGDVAGFAVAGAGDVNGDGVDDLFVGAFGADGTHDVELAGAGYVIFGKTSGFAAVVDLDDVAAGSGGFILNGRDEWDWTGKEVASAGDVNGDGFDDLLISTPWGTGADNATKYSGEAYVVFGRGDGFGASVDLESIAAGDGGFIIYGKEKFHFAGSDVASAGDINGDGFDDLLIGASGYAAGDVAEENRPAGETYVVYGRDFSGIVTHGGTASAEALSGASGDDIMVAGRGKDTLSGSGGADALNGGAGSDRLDGGAGGDRIDGGSGRDTAVYSASPEGVTVDLASGRNANGDAAADHLDGIENVTGSGFADTLIGDAAANRLQGAAGADLLRGGFGADTLDGGAGIDTLDGGAGNDIYYVNVSGDLITESLDQASGGIDLVISSISWQLGSLQERLTLTGSAVMGTGNNLDNVLTGNAAANVLKGRLGADTLKGGGGADAFVFDGALTPHNIDRFPDFDSAADVLRLDDDVFTAFTKGVAVADAQLHAAAGANAAQDADDRLIYDTTTGALYYDGDGTGSAASAIQFAVLGTSSHPTLSASDFAIIG